MPSDQVMLSTYLHRTVQVGLIVQGLATLVLIIILLENLASYGQIQGKSTIACPSTTEFGIENYGNARGLRTNIGELANLCHAKQPSFVIIVETFLDPSVPDGDYSIAIPGYCLCCRGDRLGTTGGGITVYFLGRNSSTS